ncbi:MAG: TIGR04086 family membrane protein [Syntrophaceticus sp.]|jgi:putative membrane protein (TIGR04086 family)|nr:TIGR04086 family membrane protein [Syntrophaceticus sp.]MDD3314873.1 TIGR04086 family membrane protein [Syntrophaceticus sp.]MDD4359205.1 TIGR04086 family membrane protein [Syntrophaceticus sp.]MDD4782039.1 TIGR04086 family membrane protein [Syntrophaceticus sp.]HBG22547.1 TIGR04086 family membrane protein [Peptococcaceae bacterium]
MSDEKSSLLSINGNPILFGLTAAILFAIISIVIIALCFQFTALKEVYLEPVGTFLYLVGAFLGGFLAAKKAGGKGLLYGLEVGTFYYLFFVIISLVLSTSSLSLIALGLKALYTILVSVAGGICGLAFA